ncbi:uncharacterized protein LOC107042508 isoform X2 [Diachasma alloeum]|uniref:uncharacterized protein LOC107042508 isoform X2 n=1 Tax=Diachasma alloeum TaxID=454923 RepID=UPI0007381560|nr:uncharacterized protein LOC107042508 isoform X2 [Diachasma alloeum]
MPKRKRSRSPNILSSTEEIKRACIELATVNGGPLSIIDDSGFQRLLSPLLRAVNAQKCAKISSATIQERIEAEVEGIRASIRNDLIGKLISLKVDAATLFNRRFLCISGHYFDAGMIQVRTLGIIEMTHKYTAEHFKAEIEKMLKKNLFIGDKLE